MSNNTSVKYQFGHFRLAKCSFLLKRTGILRWIGLGVHGEVPLKSLESEFTFNFRINHAEDCTGERIVGQYKRVTMRHSYVLKSSRRPYVSK